MTKTKQIPCKVCGKMFTPCAWCQGHNEIFRWRNFACSRECGKIYIERAIAYNQKQVTSQAEVVETTKKKRKKSVQTETVVEETKINTDNTDMSDSVVTDAIAEHDVVTE